MNRRIDLMTLTGFDDCRVSGPAVHTPLSPDRLLLPMRPESTPKSYSLQDLRTQVHFNANLYSAPVLLTVLVQDVINIIPLDHFVV